MISIQSVHKDVDTHDVAETIGHLCGAYETSKEDYHDARTGILEKIHLLTEIIIMKHSTLIVTED